MAEKEPRPALALGLAARSLAAAVVVVIAAVACLVLVDTREPAVDADALAARTQEHPTAEERTGAPPASGRNDGADRPSDDSDGPDAPDGFDGPNAGGDGDTPTGGETSPRRRPGERANGAADPGRRAGTQAAADPRAGSAGGASADETGVAVRRQWDEPRRAAEGAERAEFGPDPRARGGRRPAQRDDRITMSRAGSWTANDDLAASALCSREPYPFPFRRHDAPRVTPRALDEQVISSVGEQRVAVLVVYSAYTHRPTKSNAQLAYEILDERNERSFASYWRAVSFGAINLTGAVHGPYDGGSARFSFDFVKAAVDAAERAGDVDWTDVDRLYVLVPPGNGRATPFRAMAAFGDSWNPVVELPNGRLVTAAVTMIDERSMGVAAPSEGGFASGGGRHEFGHTLGWGHQGHLQCENGAAYDLDACGVTTSGVPLGGISMGQGRTPTAPELEAVGWTRPDRVFTIDRPGVFVVPLHALSSPSGVHVVKIPRDEAGGHYYLEFRRPVGLFESDLWDHPWSPLGGPLVDFDGVFVAIDGTHLPGHGLLSSVTLDMTPGEERLDHFNTGLKPGASFVCPTFGTSIAVTSIDDETAIVRIEVSVLPAGSAPEERDDEADAWNAYFELISDPQTTVEELTEALDEILGS